MYVSGGPPAHTYRYTRQTACSHTYAYTYIRTGLMRVGHAVVAEQLQRGAREAAAVEGERARLDLLVQAVHRLVERVLGEGSE